MSETLKGYAVLGVAVVFVLVCNATLDAAWAADPHAGLKGYWSYEGKTGPKYWGKLDKKYKWCSKGKTQSPINIDLDEAVRSKLDKLQTKYFTAQAINIINNGHTIKVDYEGNGTLTVGQKKYEVLQLHFHSVSEHTLGGKHAEMEIHLVHKSKFDGLAVIAIMVNKGAENKVLDRIWANIPKETGEEKVRSIPLNLMDLLPGNLGYYTYPGSLTTPPCTEGVTWYVLKNPIEMSEDQIDAFRTIYDNNRRPVQPYNNRSLRSSIR